MIYIDDRIGSKELVDLINDSILVNLDYGDVSFEGNSAEGKIQIGIERKTWGDLINSFRSGRLVGHQIIGLFENYQKIYLICEGIIRENKKSGVIEEWRHGKWKKVDYSESERARQRFAYQAVWKHLITLETKLGIEIRTTADLGETARMIEVLHEWWGEPWESHKSHVQHYVGNQTALLRPSKPSWPVQFAANLPCRVGWGKAAIIAKHFGRVREMNEASVAQWMEVDGIGKTLANQIWRALHT